MENKNCEFTFEDLFILKSITKDVSIKNESYLIDLLNEQEEMGKLGDEILCSQVEEEICKYSEKQRKYNALMKKLKKALLSYEF